MTRDYLKVNGVPIAVEVDGAPDTPAIEAELRRVYGPSFGLAGRWSRRGKKRRAEVTQTKSIRPRTTRPDWLGGL